MPTEPLPPPLSAIVDRSADVVDPLGGNDGVAYVVERFQDRDEPVTAGLRGLETELAEIVGRVDPQEEDPAVVMMSAVILHLAHRRDELSADPDRVLQQAARHEWHGRPPEPVPAWLEQRGVRV